MGIVARKILETSSVDQLKKLLRDIKNVFPACEDPLGDLTKGVAFWDQTMAVVQVLSRCDPKYQPLMQEFEKANKFLAKKRGIIQLLTPPIDQIIIK